MANPQLENGFTMIADEILEALAGIRVPGQAWQVLCVVIRKTYGFKKKTDYISLSQFRELTGMPQPNIVRAINKLVSMNLIIKKDNRLIKKDKGITVTYRFNKDYDTWIALPKKIRGRREITKKDNMGLSKKVHTIETTTKEIKDIPRNGDSVKDPTWGWICKAVVDEIKSKLGATCPYPLAGKIIHKAGWKPPDAYPWGTYGRIMVCVGRVSNWITEKAFIGAINIDLKRTFREWPDTDRDLIKSHENKFEQWLNDEFKVNMPCKTERRK